MSAWNRFWDGFTISTARLAVFRFCFFLILGWDCWDQISHAPRYGAGGLNVSHFPLLDDVLPMPERLWMLGAYVLMSYLSFRIALGGATRFALPLLTGLWGATYFISQLDSYQHHYLIFLVLLICCFIPWDAPREDPREDGSDVRASWAVRLLTVQISILYFWTTITKLDPLWLSGETLSSQIKVPWVKAWMLSAAQTLDTDIAGLWALAAVAVAAGELAVAVGWQLRRFWLPTLLLGLSFHAGVELVEFKIGLFSYFMFTIYLLIVPSSVIKVLYGFRAFAPRLPGGAVGTPALAVALVAGAAILAQIPFESTALIVALITGTALILEPRSDAESRDQRALTHVLVCLMVLGLHSQTDQIRDYFRYLGGDTRRRGDLITATMAYRSVTEIDETYASGFYRLGDLLYRQKQYEAAISPLERARALDPGEWQMHLRAAQVYDALDRGPDAYAAASRVLELKPDQSTAEKIASRHGPSDP